MTTFARVVYDPTLEHAVTQGLSQKFVSAGDKNGELGPEVPQWGPGAEPWWGLGAWEC